MTNIQRSQIEFFEGSEVGLEASDLKKSETKEIFWQQSVEGWDTLDRRPCVSFEDKLFVVYTQKQKK